MCVCARGRARVFLCVCEKCKELGKWSTNINVLSRPNLIEYDQSNFKMIRFIAYIQYVCTYSVHVPFLKEMFLHALSAFPCGS